MRRVRNDNDFVFQIILFGAIAAIVIVAFFISRMRSRKRTEAIERIAAELGLDFSPEVGDGHVSSLEHFELFSKGRSKKAMNRLHGISDGRSLSVFDYRYTTGGGKNSHTWHTTVLQVEFDGEPLPQFALRPEGVWDKIAAKFGSHDIDFDTHPEFSRMYVLRGDNETAIRTAFTPAVLQYFEAHPGLHVEAWDRSLLFYRLGKRVKPHEFNTFLAGGLSLLAAFDRA